MEWFPEHTLVPLTYRDSFEHAYGVIRDCDFVVGYDGMWHKIGRNFSKPMLIPSWEGITTYNTPQAIKFPNREKFLEFIGDGGEHFTKGLTEMKDKARHHLVKWAKIYED